MSRVCSVCGKGKMRGNLVSHSNRKTPRHTVPNVQKKTREVDGVLVRAYVCTKCIKTDKKDNA